ncbi:MAG TPA: hypothetical protein VGK63_01835, partial [Candidatus Limnocylindrales bacterium]
MTSLVDRSLVRTTIDGKGEPRFTLLEMIREHAGERLAETPALAEAVRAAHAEHYARLAEESAPTVAEPDAELDNIRIAWRYWKDARDAPHLVAMFDRLCSLLDRRGAYLTIIEIADEIIAVLAADTERAAGVEML